MAIEKAAEENTVKKGFVTFVSSENRFSLCNAAGGDDTQPKAPQPPAAAVPGPWL